MGQTTFRSVEERLNQVGQRRGDVERRRREIGDILRNKKAEVAESTRLQQQLSAQAHEAKAAVKEVGVKYEKLSKYSHLVTDLVVRSAPLKAVVQLTDIPISS